MVLCDQCLINYHRNPLVEVITIAYIKVFNALHADGGDWTKIALLLVQLQCLQISFSDRTSEGRNGS